MAQFETWLKSDLKKPVEVVKLKGNLFSADNGGNLIGVEVLDDGSPATLSGEVHGYAIREDNYTVFIEGTLANNKASIVLPLACYNVVGQISIVIKVGETTVGACTGYVYRSTTDAVVDPAHVIPSIEELLAQIDACIEATDDANEAAEKIDNMTVAATGLAYDANPTATISEVSGHKHIAFGIPAGTPATIKTQTDYYQNSSSGTVIPSGEWSTTQPTTPQGSFLWVKHHIVWYDDTETDVYSVSRQGVDGNGSVSSILLGSNQFSPDASGQITLPVDNAPTADSGNLVLSGALQSQFSALNSKFSESIMLNNLGSMDNKDLNDFGTSSMYGYWTSANKSSISNKPSDSVGAAFTIAGQYGRTFQFSYTDQLYFRYHGTGTDWTNWVCMNIIPQKVIDASTETSSKTLNLGKNQRATIDFVSNANSSFSIIVFTSSTGAVAILEKAKGSDVTINTSTASQITVNFASSRAGYFFVQTPTQTLLDRITLAT